MKLKIILATLLVLPLLTVAQTQRVAIGADIRGHACGGGFGLCSKATIAEKEGSTVVAQKLGETSILLIIGRQNLTNENQESIAGKELAKVSQTEKPSFIQQTDLFFDKQTLQKLDINPKYNQIKAGSYPMIIDAESVLVTFTLSE